MDDLDFNRIDYAESIGISEEFDKLLLLCKSEEEIDALAFCIFVINNDYAKYHHAVFFRPHDEIGRVKAYNKLLLTATQQEIDDTLLEWEAADPVRSTIQEIKNNIFDSCEQTMKDAGMSQKKWLRLKPSLTKYLNRSLIQNERIDSLVFARLLKNKLNKLT